MNLPDWSKAPEGATHVNGAGVFLRVNDSGSVSSYDQGRWVMGSHTISHFNPDYIQARPAQAWTGEGLPPVGIECERCWNGADRSYFRVKVLAHDGDKAVFRWLDGDRAGELQDDPPGALGGVKRFRPIRTPEQIAAEEREKAVSEMAEIAQVATGLIVNRADFEALYDAGYRKAEGGAA